MSAQKELFEMEQYKEFVSYLAEASSPREFINSGVEHAVIVFENIFKYSREEVCIFSGNLCNWGEYEQRYTDTISDFIERGGKVKIIFNAFDQDTAIKHSLFDRLAYYQYAKKNIEVKTTTERFIDNNTQKEVHFTVGDGKSYRLETDIDKKTARCSFSNADYAQSLLDMFNTTFNQSTGLNMIELLNTKPDAVS